MNVLVLALASAVLAADMGKAPVVSPMKPVALPARVEWKLPNGLSVVLVEDHRLPMVTAALAAPAGQAAVAAEDAGLVDAMAELLTEGTETKTAKQVAEAAESFGGDVSAKPTPDAVILGASALSDKSEAMFALLSEVARRPSFPEAEVALRRDNMKEELAANRAESDFLAALAFYKKAFPGHPYGVTAPTDASIARVTRDRVKAVWARVFTPHGATLVLVGDMSPAQARALVAKHFGAWAGAKAPAGAGAAPASKAKTAVFLLDRPKSSQVSFYLGNAAIREDNPSYFDLLLANQVLGGSFSSRLMRDLREERGFTYGVRSRLQHRRAASLFVVRTPVRNEVASDALDGILGHLRRLRKDLVSPAELDQAKAYLSGSFARALETQDGVAEAVLHLKLQRLPADFYDTYVQKIQAVTPSGARRAALTFIRPDELVIVAVGDASVVKAALAKFSKSPVVMVDQDGE